MSFYLKGEIMFPTSPGQQVGTIARDLGLTYNNAPYRDFQSIQAIEQSRVPQQQQQSTGGYSTPDYRGQTLAALRSSMDLLNQREAEASNLLGQEFGTQKAALEAGRATGLGNLARQKETTTRQKDISLRDLAQNIRNAYQGGMNKLATGGAADSSASKMYRFALGQQEAQNRGKLLSDYNYNLGNIDLQQRNLETDFATKMRGLEQWKASQAYRIADQFRNARDEINQKMAGLGAGAISLAQSQLAQQAASQLANLSTQVGSAAGLIQNDYEKAAAQLRQYQPENMNPDVAIQQQNIPGRTADIYGPIARREEEQQVA
jgi:hypothetical protein